MADESNIRKDKGICVIIPAFNEEPVIRSTVQSVLDGLPADAQVIIAFNGCADQIQHSIKDVEDSRLSVINLDKANKALAIRAAENISTKYPRFYVDADIRIRGSDLANIADSIHRDGLELASPRLVMDLSKCTMLARILSETWMQLPHARHEAFQAVIGVSREGRLRWGQMPDVIADDMFIKSCISRDRRAIIEDVEAIVCPPRQLWPFVRVRMRMEEGRRQLNSQKIRVPIARRQRRALLLAVLRPNSAFGAVVYALAVLTAKTLVKLRFNRKANWHQDRSAREIVGRSIPR
jgi:glycosyltransferase involved in cell wall biosynthesis